MLLTGFLGRYDVTYILYIYMQDKLKHCFYLCVFYTSVFFKSSEVNYLTLQDLDEVLELFANQEEEEEEGEEKHERRMEGEMITEINDSLFSKCLILKWRELKERNQTVAKKGEICEYLCVSVCISVFLCLPSVKLEDEIAASVYINRGKMLDMDSITQLTSDNFHDAVAQSSLTVALFYLKCKTHFAYWPVKEGKQMNIN